MKVGALCVAALLSVASLSSAAKATKKPVPVRDRFNGVCEKDSDCKKFPGTVCVKILTGDYTQGKCTPNYGKRPVCRGGQAGLCPSYQDPSAGYLNTQCVLIDKAMQPATDTDAIVPVDKPAASGTTPAASGAPAAATTAAPGTTAAPAKTAAGRFLAATVETTTTAAPGTTAAAGTTEAPSETTVKPSGTTATPKKTTAAPVDSGSASESESGSGSDGTIDRTPVKDQECPTDTSLKLADPKCWFNTPYKNTTLTVQYRCVDYDMCLEQSAYSQESQTVKEAYCRPANCVTGPKSLCNNRGTCQANSPIDMMLPRTYACRCYAGFTGTKCEKTDGTAECDVDCGFGGACTDNKCDCFEGFVGKNLRCDKCTSNAACENDNKCNIDTGKCACGPGFNGDTCGGKLDVCAGVVCKNGGFIDSSSGKTCQCNCPKCPAGTKCQTCGGADGRDCSTCPAVESGASAISIMSTTLVMAVAAMLH
uniref:Secreted protein n=1 Tax=Achlya hypogyna TaxID=1202772 RepID=A0A0A7CNT5_ACHHY|nr:secreted protein [Achlya hypogyna]